MPTYLKKPTTAEAIPVRDVIAAHAGEPNAGPLPDWLRAAIQRGGFAVEPTGITVTTPEGSARAGIDDWLVQDRGVDYVRPVKASVFAGEYEPAALQDADAIVTPATATRPTRTPASKRITDES